MASQAPASFTARRHALLAHGFNWQVVEDSIGLVCCSWVSWWGGAVIEEREALLLSSARQGLALHCDLGVLGHGSDMSEP